MNIAFGALMLLLLLIPGLFFRVAYLNVRYSGKSFKTTFIDETLLALAPAFIIQILGFLFVENVLGKNVSLETIYQVVISSAALKSFNVIQHSLGQYLLYNILLWTSAWLLGYATRRLIKRFKLHYKYPLFRFQNDWYHILRGTILNFPGYEGQTSDIAFVWVDVVLETRDSSYIYSGIVQEFFLSKDEGLDRIYLINVRRRKLSDDLETAQLADATTTENSDVSDNDAPSTEIDKRYYYMPGDLFVIPYSQIRSLNVTYYKKED
jgi:hypothetical protein